ncbi:MAG: tetratricopeptide repeat protein [Chthoniobacterales bacterium]
MKRAAAAFLFVLVSLGSAPGQEAAPDPATDPLVMQRRLAMVLRQSTQHYEAGEYDTALERLGAIQGPPANDLSVLNLRGAILTKLGRYDEASESFRAILSAQPDFFPAAFNLGEVEFIRGDYADALELFGDMRRREPRNELVRFKILLCQLLLGLDEDAQKTARGLVSAGSTPAWYYAQAMLARKAGDEASAAKHLHAAKAIYEDEGCKLFDESIAPVKF